jgi:outer membrane protein OmpA-like peptidoglycan-associated protein
MKIKALTLLVLFALLSSSLFSQTKENPNAIGLFGLKHCYVGSLGNGFGDFSQPFNGFVGVSFLKYYDNNLNFSLNADFGKLAYEKNEKKTYEENLTHLSLRVHYKFANGYILPEDARFAPFLTSGIGLAFFGGDDKIEKHKDVLFPLGIGFNYRINDKWALQYQGNMNITVMKYPKDGKGQSSEDHFFGHSLGVVYSMASCCKNKGTKDKDSDGDGVMDRADKCPGTPKGVKVDIDGCPVVSAETKKILDDAITGVQFETSKDVITTESFPILDNVVNVMKNNPAYKLEINGHTDNQGDDAMNLDLSKRRAAAVKKYLVSKGVAENRLKDQGFGETKPIADNNTAEGRAKNRRVEFKIVF